MAFLKPTLDSAINKIGSGPLADDNVSPSFAENSDDALDLEETKLPEDHPAVASDAAHLLDSIAREYRCKRAAGLVPAKPLPARWLLWREAEERVKAQAAGDPGKRGKCIYGRDKVEELCDCEEYDSHGSGFYGTCGLCGHGGVWHRLLSGQNRYMSLDTIEHFCRADMLDTFDLEDLCLDEMDNLDESEEDDELYSSEPTWTGGQSGYGVMEEKPDEVEDSELYGSDSEIGHSTGLRLRSGLSRSAGDSEDRPPSFYNVFSHSRHTSPSTLGALVRKVNELAQRRVSESSTEQRYSEGIH